MTKSKDETGLVITKTKIEGQPVTITELDGKRICGTKTQSGTPCKQPAGLGTEHLGWGKCKFHGGTSPGLVKNAARQEIAVRLAGIGQQGRDVSPGMALLEEVRRSAGIVDWLGSVIGEWDTSTKEARQRLFLTLGEQGMSQAAWVKIYQDERKHLAQVAKMALDAGVAERQVRLAEEQGAMIAFVIRQVLDDIRLTPEQQQQAPQIVRKHLMVVAQQTAG